MHQKVLRECMQTACDKAVLQPGSSQVGSLPTQKTKMRKKMKKKMKEKINDKNYKKMMKD